MFVNTNDYKIMHGGHVSTTAARCLVYADTKCIINPKSIFMTHKWVTMLLHSDKVKHRPLPYVAHLLLKICKYHEEEPSTNYVSARGALTLY